MIIDTNVYSALDKGVMSAVATIQLQTVLFMTTPVLGELKFGFANGQRQQVNEDRLVKFIAQNSVEILTLSVKTADVYADLAAYCRQTGRALSTNDLWIAALALEHDVSLVTYDKDFAALVDRLGDRLVLLED